MGQAVERETTFWYECLHVDQSTQRDHITTISIELNGH
jgi:hypothetical protein